jgi:hypothetical protein
VSLEPYRYTYLLGVSIVCLIISPTSLKIRDVCSIGLELRERLENVSGITPGLYGFC